MMPRKPRVSRLTNPENARLTSRLLSSLPAASFELETFARLAGVVASRDIPTAAMECTYRPRLLINPEFVEKYCKRDEHLFLLVMHELWHVLLAHTALYPRVTQAQNVAFDAIINAGLMRRFNAPEYRGFFEELNPPDTFPHLLLRPPVGWPDNPEYPTDIGPEGTVRVLQQLYPPPNVQRRVLPFYQEILDLIKQHVKENGGTIVQVGGVGEPVLIGDHNGIDSNKRAAADAYLGDVLDQVSEGWPMTPGEFGLPGMGGSLENRQAQLRSTSEAARRSFSRVLRRCLSPKPGDFRRRTRLPAPGISGTSVLPNARDRHAPARRILGAPNTIWLQPGESKVRLLERQNRAHIYLDVSGSMSRVIPQLLGLILPYVANGEADVFQFSTEVEHLPLAELKTGQLRTTGGTNITCVMEHLLDAGNRVRRTLILTDGYTGMPKSEHAAAMRDLNMRVHVVLPGESPFKDHLQTIAQSFTVLPPMSGRIRH